MVLSCAFAGSSGLGSGSGSTTFALWNTTTFTVFSLENVTEENLSASLGFSATVIVTVAAPVPEAGDTVTHESFGVAVHERPFVLTSTVWDDCLPSKFTLLGVTLRTSAGDSLEFSLSQLTAASDAMPAATANAT